MRVDFTFDPEWLFMKYDNAKRRADEAEAERDAAVARAEKAEADLLEIRRDADWARNDAACLRTAVLNHRKEWRKVEDACNAGHGKTAAEVADLVVGMDKEIARLRRKAAKANERADLMGDEIAEAKQILRSTLFACAPDDTEISLKTMACQANVRIRQYEGAEKTREQKADTTIADILGWAIHYAEGCAMFDCAEAVAHRAAGLIRRQKRTLDAVRRGLQEISSAEPDAPMDELVNGVAESFRAVSNRANEERRTLAIVRRDLEEIVGKEAGDEIADVVERVNQKIADKDRLAVWLGEIVENATDAVNEGLLRISGDSKERVLKDAVSRAVDNEKATRTLLLRLLGRSESGATTPVLAKKAAELVAGLKAQHKRAREEVRHLDRMYDEALDRAHKARCILAPLVDCSEPGRIVALAEAVAEKIEELKRKKPAVVWVTDPACGPFRWVSAPAKPAEDATQKTCGECKRFVPSTMGDGTRGTCSCGWSDTLASSAACNSFVSKGEAPAEAKTCGSCYRFAGDSKEHPGGICLDCVGGRPCFVALPLGENTAACDGFRSREG